MKTHTLRAVFSVISAVLMALCLLSGGLGLTARLTLCNPALLHRAVEDSGFAETAKQEITDKWQDLFGACGIENADTLTGLLNAEDIRQTVDDYIDGAYTGASVFDTEVLEQSLQEGITALVSLPGNATEAERQEYDANVATLVGECADAYTQSLRIRLLPSILGFFGSVAGKLTALSVAALGFALLLCIFLWFLQSTRRNFFYYGAMGLLSCGAVVAAVQILQAVLGIRRNLPLGASALRDLLQTYLGMLIGAFWILPAVCGVISTVFIVIYFVLRKKNKKAECV